MVRLAEHAAAQRTCQARLRGLRRPQRPACDVFDGRLPEADLVVDAIVRHRSVACAGCGEHGADRSHQRARGAGIRARCAQWHRRRPRQRARCGRVRDTHDRIHRRQDRACAPARRWTTSAAGAGDARASCRVVVDAAGAAELLERRRSVALAATARARLAQGHERPRAVHRRRSRQRRRDPACARKRRCAAAPDWWTSPRARRMCPRCWRGCRKRWRTRRRTLRGFEAPLDRADVIAIGPGLGQREWGSRAAWSSARRGQAAGARCRCAQPAGRITRCLPADAILTPHPGEAARLLGSTTADVQRDRFGAARELSERHRCVVVLKGAGSDRGIARQHAARDRRRQSRHGGWRHGRCVDRSHRGAARAGLCQRSMRRARARCCMRWPATPRRAMTASAACCPAI